MGTTSQTELYRAAFASGRFFVRGFGPEPFRLNGSLGESNAAIHKAAGCAQIGPVRPSYFIAWDDIRERVLHHHSAYRPLPPLCEVEVAGNEFGGLGRCM